MGMRFDAGVRISAIAMLGLVQMAQKPDAGRPLRIFVVAVHDSSLFTMCPTSKQQTTGGYFAASGSRQLILSPDGTVLNVPVQIQPQLGPTSQRMRPDWLNLQNKAPNLCPSGWLDSDLRQNLEKELSNHKEYVLAGSAEDADLVFLAEGLYTRTPRPVARSNKGSRAALQIQSILTVAMAIAVSSDVYRRNPANSAVLLKAALWEGAEAYRSAFAGRSGPSKIEPVSIRRLVAQFVDRKKQKSKLPPLCAVYTSPALSDSDPARNIPKAGERKRPVPGGIPKEGTVRDNVFKINVELVTVPVIARTSQGRYVPDLTAQDFHVFENGIEQKIDRLVPVDAPFDVALMLDLSNSTVFKHEDIRSAALAFVDALRPADRVMIVSFSSSINLDSEFTGDRNELRRVISQTHVIGKTRLYDAVDLVMTERMSRIQGRKAIVLFTDGLDTQSWLASAASSLSRVQESDVLVYVIRYDTKPPDLTRLAAARASEYLQGLCDHSGGRLFNASSVRGLHGAFAQIADELRHQYALCYYPQERTGDGSLRLLRVTVERPDVRIRARTGYRPLAAPAK